MFLPALAHEDCDTAQVVLGKGEEHSFTKDTDRPEINLFVKAESSFEGFSVNVQDVGGTEHTAWFPAEDECFPREDTWYQLLAFARIKNSTIVFGFETKTCRKECERIKPPWGLQQKSVVPRGASRWRQTFPEPHCATAKLEAMIFSGNLSLCIEPLVPTSTVIILVVLVVMVSLLLVVAVVIKKRATLREVNGGVSKN